MWKFSKAMNLTSEAAYRTWRERKLARYPQSADDIRVRIADLAAPTPGEKQAIADACRRCGMAIYEAGSTGAEAGTARAALVQFAAAFGLGPPERHRSAGSDGIVAIEVTESGGKRGFIPYTTRPLNWHTDGYYNGPGEAVRAMILHCVRPAARGGENALLDPEILYIRLRDHEPGLLAALMHEEAMTIPASVEEDGRVRPESTGPVFSFDPESNHLSMRYTARARNVSWRDDADTRAAVAFLERLLAHGEEPLIIRHRLSAGEGLVSNNVLHTRTAFEDDPGSKRLLLRGRYGTRVAGT